MGVPALELGQTAGMAGDLDNLLDDKQIFDDNPKEQDEYGNLRLCMNSLMVLSAFLTPLWKRGC